MAGLVRELAHGPIDIIGDVHGEIEALRALLGRLGYEPTGRHPEGRRPIFVGDLTDRGPDSPAVVRLVRRLIDDGRAQAVLGNHELNALKAAQDGQFKPDLCWLFPMARPMRHSGRLVPMIPAGAESRDILSFFASLPIALERAGPDPVRVIHACWDDSAIETIRRETNVLDAFYRARRQIDRELNTAAIAEYENRELIHQNENPVRLLTSGREHPTSVPIIINEKPRYRLRDPWWERYSDAPLTVFGHYWRIGIPGETHEKHLFGGKPRHALLGRGMCIDYSVGRRFRERIDGPPLGPYLTSLGALRLPERILYFDNAEPVSLIGG
jgi:hypothetical protein